MRLSNILITLFGTTVLASSSNLKSYILTFDDDQPSLDSTLDAFKDLVTQAGGTITHEYSLIKGFSMQLPADYTQSVLEKLDAVASKIGCTFHLEQDSEVHAFTGHPF